MPIVNFREDIGTFFRTISLFTDIKKKVMSKEEDDEDPLIIFTIHIIVLNGIQRAIKNQKKILKGAHFFTRAYSGFVSLILHVSLNFDIIQ